MFHTCLHVKCDPGYTEILLAELAQADFDSFLENETGFEAYVEGEAYNKTMVEAIFQKYRAVTRVDYSFSQIQKRNWNEEWERSYSPTVVEDQCLIRASFHQPQKPYPLEIIITPKMSFGTGHHPTTYLMVKNMLPMDFRAKRVVDAGCGTAVLSVLASKLGAKEVQAFDIDEWSVVNGNENKEINGCNNIHIQQGSINEIQLSGKFDIVLANINKNVLHDEIQIYARYLTAGGYLLLSGFLTPDIPELLKEASRHQLTVVHHDERETWASLLLQAEG